MSANEATPTDPGRRRWRAFTYFLSAQRGVFLAIAIFALIFGAYGWKQEVGLTSNIINTAANKGTLLALVAMAQTIPVITGGLDLSVGMVFLLTNCLASTLVTGDPLMTAIGVIVVLFAGLLCGTLNGLIVVYGRLQPIIVTLATSAIYFGIAVILRPQPGGTVNFALADIMTGSYYGVPASIMVLVAAVLLVWIPYKRSVLGRAAFAIGSSEPAAFMSGVPIARAKILAYALSGFFASIAGLMLTFLTYSGAAKVQIGNDYTLNSIAAVVIGGTSLSGGVGRLTGTIIGAVILGVLTSGFTFLNVDAHYQEIIKGGVIVAAVIADQYRQRKRRSV